MNKSAENIDNCTFKLYINYNSAKMESIKKLYHKLPSAEFNSLIDSIKNSFDTLTLFDNTKKIYYFKTDESLYSLLLKIHKIQIEFDFMIDSFSQFKQKQIIQSFLIEEIQSTNQIENIYSDKDDIFYAISEGLKGDDTSIISVANAYTKVLGKELCNIDDLKSIREIYDILMKDNLDKEDSPDGQYFRKERVYINDGIKNIHQGFYPEEKVNQGMEEFLKIYNNSNLDIYVSMALSHFVFENVHPFYDGNGRTGRLLLSMNMFANTNSYLSFVLSKAISESKSKYYKIFEDAKDDREQGILNNYVYEFCRIICDYFKEVLDNLKFKKDIINGYHTDDYGSKSENKVIGLLKEASVLSEYGVNKQEIMNYTDVSKRTLMYILKKLKQCNMIESTRIGRNNYYRLTQ